MGRYTTVQAYSDNNANMRSVSYEQASGSAGQKKGAVKPEKVNNPYGSTAGAGSGEFHVYRHARAREMARWERLDQEEENKILDDEFKTKVEEYTNEEEKRTEQRRKKRKRQKEAKQRKKNLERAGIALANTDKAEANKEEEEEEFSYIPTSKQPPEEKKSSGEDSSGTPQLAFANDGSFLEAMKAKLDAESQGGEKDDVKEPPIKKQAVGTDEQ